MGKPAERDDIDASCRHLAKVGEGDAAGSLGDHAAADQIDRLLQFRRGHVVEQHGIGADLDHFPELLEGIDLHLDLDHVAEPLAGAADGGFDAAGGDDVVVLDEDAVVEAEAVVDAAAHPDRVFLQHSQAGCGLAGTDDAGARSLHHLRGGAGGGGDTA